MNFKRAIIPAALAAYLAFCVYFYLQMDSNSTQPTYASAALTGAVILGLLLLVGFVSYQSLRTVRFSLLHWSIKPQLVGSVLWVQYRTVVGFSYKREVADLNAVGHILVNKSNVNPVDSVEFWSEDPEAQYVGQVLTPKNGAASLVGWMSTEPLHAKQAFREELTALLYEFYGPDKPFAPQVNLTSWETNLSVPASPTMGEDD